MCEGLLLKEEYKFSCQSWLDPCRCGSYTLANANWVRNIYPSFGEKWQYFLIIIISPLFFRIAHVYGEEFLHTCTHPGGCSNYIDSFWLYGVQNEVKVAIAKAGGLCSITFPCFLNMGTTLCNTSLSFIKLPSGILDALWVELFACRNSPPT